MHVQKLESLDRDMPSVGQKASGLGEMMRCGLPVPPGFVIRSEAFERFLRSNALTDKINRMMDSLGEGTDMLNISAKLQELILTSVMPEFLMKEFREAYDELSLGKEIKELGGMALDMVKAGRGKAMVAVRCSPCVAGLQGQLHTSLNVNGVQELDRAIKHCWASLFNPAILSSRDPLKVPIAVIVQRMVEPEKSGVLYSSNPLSGEDAAVESSWGYGDILSKGHVVPDFYVISKSSGDIADSKISQKRWMNRKDEMNGNMVRIGVHPEKISASSLETAESRRLADIAKRVESHFGTPQEVAFSVERGRLFLLQSTPIMDMGPAGLQDRNYGEVVIKGMPGFRGTARSGVRVVSGMQDMENIQGEILVTRMTQPAMIPFLKHAGGLVVEEGGLSCHAAVSSRELGIPCIVGASGALGKFQNGEEVILDSFSGEVMRESQQHVETPLTEAVQDVTEEADMTGTRIYARLHHPAPIQGADGIVAESERILTDGQHPVQKASEDPDGLAGQIVSYLEGMHGRVWYRALDMRTDELRELQGFQEPAEENPLMGWRGTRRILDQDAVFRCELQALSRLKDRGKEVGLLLPFVSSVEEFRRVKKRIRDIMGIGGSIPFKLGVSLEIPSAVIESGEMCSEGASLVLIEPAELAQFVMGMDRNNDRVSRHFRTETEPVRKMVKGAIEACGGTAESCVVCSPENAEQYVEMGASSVLLEPDDIAAAKAPISRAERRILLIRARNGYT